MSLLLKRYSCRSFTDEKVSEEDIKKLLISGMQAPSAVNQQPWEFIVVDDLALLEKLSETSKGAWMLKNVKQAIVVIMTNTDKAPMMSPQDCAAATQNILLEATNLNLGAVWIGVYPREERMDYLNPLLNVPQDKTVFSMIALGHPDNHKEVTLRYDDSRVHRNRMN